MPSKQWNGFYNGQSRDDFVAPENQYIDGKNVTGLRTGYGITLGPKVTKQLLTNGNAARTIFGRELSSGALTSIAVGCDTGEIYKLTSTDNTPIHTLTSGFDILNGAILFKGSNFMYFASKMPGLLSSSAEIMQVTFQDFENETFASKNEVFIILNNIETPPMLITGGNLYIGGLNTVFKIDSVGVITTFAIFNRNVTGISVHGTRFFIYTDDGDVIVWDGETTSTTAFLHPGFRPSRVVIDGGLDHIIDQNGDYRQGSGYEFSDPITKSQQSRRLEDNTQYIEKFNFTPNITTGQPMAVVKGGLFMIANETKPGIYQRDKLIEGLPAGFHKTITQDDTDVDFDEIFTLAYLSKRQSKLFFGFQSGTTRFGVSFIDLNTLNTVKTGHIVTNVATGPPNKENTIIVVKATTSFTSTTKTIKLYKRINNGVWTLFRTIDTNDDSTIRHKIESVDGVGNLSDKWYDIQIKAEINNPLQDDTPPILHFLELEYSVTE